MMPPKIPHDDPITLQDALVVLRSWRAEDTYPWMKRKTLSWLVPRATWIASILLLVVHLIWAINSHCSTDFARSGAAITVVAAFGAAWLDWHDPKAMLLDGGKLPVFQITQPIVAIALQVALGTLVWGYGDLLPGLTSTSCT